MQPGRRYQEWPLSGPLAATFRVIWRSERPELPVVAMRDATLPPTAALPANDLPERPLILPDGQVDLIWIDGVWRVAGPDLVAQRETVRSAATIIGFRFQPGAAAGWLRQPLPPLVNQRPALADIAPAVARRLAGSPLAHPTSVPAAVAAMASLAGEGAPVPRWLLAAYRELETSPAASSDQATNGGLDLSERTRRRHFAATFGYGPRAMGRVLRFQRFLRLLDASPDNSLSQLAFAAGYADQAHLSRECQALAGQTPAILARSRHPHRVTGRRRDARVEDAG